ncbi:uncharacterized protein LOC144169743 isoform X2 [Haemaphysalis longicornis]
MLVDARRRKVVPGATSHAWKLLRYKVTRSSTRRCGLPECTREPGQTTAAEPPSSLPSAAAMTSRGILTVPLVLCTVIMCHGDEAAIGNLTEVVIVGGTLPLTEEDVANAASTSRIYRNHGGGHSYGHYGGGLQHHGGNYGRHRGSYGKHRQRHGRHGYNKYGGNHYDRHHYGGYGGRHHGSEHYGGYGRHGARHGADHYRNRGHRNHGYKNVYHKEEYGDHKTYYDDYHEGDNRNYYGNHHNYRDHHGGREHYGNHHSGYKGGSQHGDNYYRHGGGYQSSHRGAHGSHANRNYRDGLGHKRGGGSYNRGEHGYHEHPRHLGYYARASSWVPAYLGVRGDQTCCSTERRPVTP